MIGVYAFNGRTKKIGSKIQKAVLILVVMDDALAPICFYMKSGGMSLNPCCNG